ncbi:MAG TPA: ABC transporter ATP-binding protein [Thermomicrobiales bacterium]|nr:ABC transporter ATP-binding protein [Thermomicrobiales bacterium]
MWVSELRAYYTTSSGEEVKAVDGITLDVREGEVLGIAGESGCGKSTLASILALTAQRSLAVKSGEFGFDGRNVDLTDITHAPRDWRGRLVALLPQRAMNSLNPTARIRDLAYDVIHAHEPKVTRKEAIERTRQRLEQLSLPPRVIDSYPHQLSGGMRQRVVAVISTLLNPKVLIADEPSSALDVSSQKLLIQLLQQLLEQGFITRVVFITHDLPLLSNIADRIAIMYAGKIVELGPTAQIVNRPEHPYTKSLIGSMLDPDPLVRRRRIEGLPGAPPDLRNPPAACRFHPRCKYAMDICTREDPPKVGTDDQFAACWWVQQQRERGLEGTTSESPATISASA